MKTLQSYVKKAYADARAELKAALAECSQGQQHKFKRIFANERLETPINDVVDQIDDTKLESAMGLVYRTQVQNEKREAQYLAEQS